jgi:peptide/nickel transport system permease protein
MVLPSTFATRGRALAATRRVLRNLTSRRNGAVGLYGTAVFVLVALVGPIFLGHHSLVMGDKSLAAPSLGHIMGTDEFGRDVFSRVVVGIRASLLVGVGAVVVGGIAGLAVGLPAGYFGGWAEAAVMRVCDALIAFPSIFVAIATAAVVGAGQLNIIVAIAVVNLPIFARLARGATLSEKTREYVAAARTLGVGRGTIMFGEILPNISAPIFVAAATAAPNAILLGAALDFLGLGEQPPAASLGQMISASRQFLQNDAWYALFPGIVLVALVLVLSLLGTSLPDALNPARRVVARRKRA